VRWPRQQEGKFAAQQQAKAIGKEGSAVCQSRPAFLVCEAQQCAVSQSIFTEDKKFAGCTSFAVNWSKACATSKPLFSVQSLAGARKFARVVTIWLKRQTKTIHTSAYLRLRLRRGKYIPRWQLSSKAIPFKLDHVILSDELTHDTMAVGDAAKCCNVQQCTCLDADFWLLLYSHYTALMQFQICLLPTHGWHTEQQALSQAKGRFAAECETHKQLCLDQNTQERYRLMLQFKEACKVYSFLLQNLKTL